MRWCQGTLNAYLNGMLTNAQVIEELVKMAKEMMRDRSEAEALGLTDEEMAFYDAITKPQAVKDFYDNDQLVAITRSLLRPCGAAPLSIGSAKRMLARECAEPLSGCSENTSIPLREWTTPGDGYGTM